MFFDTMPMFSDMFEFFEGGLSPRDHYAFAQIASQMHDPNAMVDQLFLMTSGVMKNKGDPKGVGERAGIAFFNLAKWFDNKGQPYRISAMKSLQYALENYRVTEKEMFIQGATEEQLISYMGNSSSPVSLKDVRVSVK